MPNESDLIIPDPIVISEKALKESSEIETRGVFVAYDPETQAGGFIVPGVKNPRWVIYMPISRTDWALELKKLLGPVIKYNRTIN